MRTVDRSWSVIFRDGTSMVVKTTGSSIRQSDTFELVKQAVKVQGRNPKDIVDWEMDV